MGHAQADALGVPLFEAVIAPRADNDAYEASFADALARAQAGTAALDTIAFGDLFLADVRAYREALLARRGWRGVFPLWGEDTARIARTFVARGHRAILCCVDTSQLDAGYCGRNYDARLLSDLPDSWCTHRRIAVQRSAQAIRDARSIISRAPWAIVLKGAEIRASAATRSQNDPAMPTL